MMYYSVMTQANTEKENPSASSDALSLSYRRLVEAKAKKLGSSDKHPAYCSDLNVNVWHMEEM